MTEEGYAKAYKLLYLYLAGTGYVKPFGKFFNFKQVLLEITADLHRLRTTVGRLLLFIFLFRNIFGNRMPYIIAAKQILKADLSRLPTRAI